MQIGAAAAALGADAVGQHAHHGVEIPALEIAVWIRAAHEREQLVLAVFARRHFGDDLLREHVERMFGDVQAVELAAAHGIEQRGAVDELVAAAREDAALGHAAHRVVGAADALQEHRDAARRAELADELHVADVDAELERGRGHHDLELAGLQALFGVEARFLGQAAVVRGHVCLTEPLGQVARDALHHAARVREHQRGVVLVDELASWSYTVAHTSPDITASSGAAGITMLMSRSRTCPRVDDGGVGAGIVEFAEDQQVACLSRTHGARHRLPTRKRATSSMGFCVADRPMRCTGCAALAHSRSSVSARCAPRLVCATAWISSTMTVRTRRQHLAARGAGEQ